MTTCGAAITSGLRQKEAALVRTRHGTGAGKRLAAKVARRYEAKGMSAKRAKYIGGAVAGKVYRAKQAKQ